MKASRSRNTTRVTVACRALFIVLFVVYYIYHQNTQLMAADNSSMFPMLLDFLGGNCLLKGWVIGSGSFAFTDTIWCVPFILAGVHYPVIMSICGAFFHAGFIAIMLWLVITDEYQRGNINKISYAIIAASVYLLLFAIVPYEGYTIENPTYIYLNLNEHSGTYLFIAVEILLLYLWRKSDYKNKILPIVFTVYGILGQISDNTPLMVFFGPLCIYSLYFIIWPDVDKRRKKDLFLICDSIFIVVSASLINKLISYLGGMEIFGVGMALNTPERILINLKMMIIKMMILFGYDTSFGIHIDGYVITVCLIVGMIAMSVLYQIVQAIRSKPDRLGLLLSLGIVSNVIGVVFIYTEGVVSSRYILSVPFFGVALLIKMLLSVFKSNRLMRNLIFGFVLILSASYSVHNLIDVSKAPNYGDDGEAVAAYIDELGGGTGYSCLWTYTTISSYTDFRTLMIPVWWDGNPVLFNHKVLINTDWYDVTDIHYIVLLSDEDDAYAVDGERSDFIKIAGEPDEDRVFGIYEVMYYEDDLSEYLYILDD